MSAVTPNLERQDELLDSVEDASQLLEPPVSDRSLSGSKSSRVRSSRATTGIEIDSILRATSTKLMNMVWLREAVEEALRGRQINVYMRGRDVILEMDSPVGQTPPWNPPPTITATRFNLLSWTSKMGCPSFATPAGHGTLGGTCPGAFQSIMDAGGEKIRQRVKTEIGTWEPHLAICNRCVTGDTRVLVRGRGLIRIDELLEQEFEVWSGQAWRKTTAVFNGIKPIVELESSWGHVIRTTADHKMITDEGAIEAQNLGYDVALKFEPPFESPFAKTARILRETSKPRYRTAVIDNFPDDWSYDVGLLLGYILGDGHVRYGKYPMVKIASSSEDAGAIADIQQIVSEWCGTRAELHEWLPPPRPGGLCATAVPKAMVGIGWRVQSLAEFLDDLGLDKRPEPEARRVPSGIWTASEDGVRGFLSGMFSTDGSVTWTDNKTEVSLASVSRGLLRDVQQLLFAFGIRSTICPYATSNIDRIAAGYRSLYKLGINAIEHVRAFARLIGLHNVRKAKRLDELLARCAAQTGRQRWPTLKQRTETLLHEPVYDLVNVGDEHQFVASCLSVSNCYAEGGQYATGQVQFAQLLRIIWVRHALREHTFVPTMVAAVKEANFHLEGGVIKEKEKDVDADGVKQARQLSPERTGERFFRIHDSGDFFSPEYLRSWKEVAQAFDGSRVGLPRTIFWAPSRIWATSWGTTAVNQINDPPDNLIIRPSAYHINEAPPAQGNLGPGWAAGSTAIHKDLQGGLEVVRARRAKLPVVHSDWVDVRYTWNCVAAGTLIPVFGRGLVAIESVRAGDEVQTRSGWRKVLRAEAKGAQATILVRTRAYAVRLTADHLVATPDGWRAAGELVPGDIACLAPEDAGASHDMPVAVPPWDASFVRKGAAADFPLATFPTHWSAELGAVLGYFAGDAHFAHSSVQVGVGAAKEPDLYALDSIVAKWIGHSARIHWRDGRESMLRGRLVTSNPSVAAHWGDLRLVRYLTAFGYAPGIGSSARRAPIGLFGASREAVLGFLGGLLSANGNVSIRPDSSAQVTFFSTSSELADDVQALLLGLGGRSTRVLSRRPPYRDLHTIIVRSARAIQALQQALIVNEAKRVALRGARTADHRRHRDTRVREVIRDNLIAEVHDIEVDGEPEFNANGLVLHNCMAYAVKDTKHTCREAIAPDGKAGCRACWIHPADIVNYTLHGTKV